MIHYMSIQGIGDPTVGNEFHCVEESGVPVRLHALRRGKRDCFKSEWAIELDHNTQYIYPLPKPRMIASAIAAPFLFGRKFWAGLSNAIFGPRENLKNRAKSFWHFWVACDWARQLREEEVTHIHSQWCHAGGTVAMYGAWLLGKPFSFTGHAADLFRDRVALQDKIRRADFIVCISEFHKQFFIEQGASPEQLHVVYCGVNLDLFRSRKHPSKNGRPFGIRSSGRLVEKKGFEYLIRACDVLARRGIDFHCVIGGSGPLLEPLQKLVSDLGLQGKVELTGKELKQEEIPSFLEGGDVYCLPCVWASDNDVDGLPQMLMEAMGCGLPAVSTRLVGIPDLVQHEQTGLLVEPKDVEAAADAMLRIKNEPGLAERLAAAGRKWCEEKFEIHRAVRPLVYLFRRQLAGAGHYADFAPQPVLGLTIGSVVCMVPGCNRVAVDGLCEEHRLHPVPASQPVGA